MPRRIGARARAVGLRAWMMACGAAIGIACSNAEQDGGDALCVPGMQVTCGCPGGDQGVQVCGFDGLSYEPCQCGDFDGSGEDSGSSSGGDESTTADACGNGLPDPGECIDDPPACPEDCDVGDDGGSSSTGADACAGMPIFALSIPNVASAWEFMGVTGFGAGNMMCASMGADHVCDYDEVVAAEANGDFAGAAAGTTAWLHRTTAANGVAAGPGGRCIDWTYSTNHLSDGEFVELGAGGVLTYHLDHDTIYDQNAGTPNPHVQVGTLECGGQTRAILCCNAECVSGR